MPTEDIYGIYGFGKNDVWAVGSRLDYNPTRISFDLPQDANVTLAIYDLLGRKVADLTNGFMKAGSYSGVWDANNNSSATLSGGMYFAHFSVSDVHGKVKFS